MTTAPSNQPTRCRPSRGLLVLTMAVAVVVIAVALLAGYLSFFGSEAPLAPTLENALKVLLPSPSPA